MAIPERRKIDEKQNYGPWVRGFVNAVEDHRIPLDGLAEAIDCDIDRDGRITSRHKWDSLDAGTEYKYLREHNGSVYGVRNGQVGRIGAASFDVIASVDGRVSWTVLNGVLHYCDYSGVFSITGEQLRCRDELIEEGLDEESRFNFVDMPGGKSCGYWQGRLLVLRGRSLLWSEPLDFGTHSRNRGFIRFPENPTWIAPLPTGVYVGLQSKVVFLSGANPDKFVMRQVGGINSPYASAVMNTQFLDPKMSGGTGEVAVWFTDVGFAIGTQDGSVLYPQAANLKGLPQLPRNLVVKDDRVYVFAIEE